MRSVYPPRNIFVPYQRIEDGKGEHTMKRKSRLFSRWRRNRELKRWLLIVVVAVVVSLLAVIIAEILDSDYHVHYPRDEERIEYLEE